ncbi:MAG: zinc dependent phospholipase C family protein [Lachnospiraceae bacterium]|nr:zinc dependent phospholipase C family protein [Lachnospiraceae bacterium]
MAQPMMHLLIADKVYKQCSLFDSYDDFLSGSIAPDAVHEKKNYTREHKDISHYRFNSKSSISYFDPFFEQYHTSENKDFVAGYLIHLLSDMIWYHSVRVPFKEAFVKAPARDISMNEAYYADCEQIEQLMFWEKDASRIIKAVSNGKAYSIEGLIDSEDVAAWKEKLLSAYDNKQKLSYHTTYITEQQVRDYIEDCAQKCSAYLEYLPYFKTHRKELFKNTD